MIRTPPSTIVVLLVMLVARPVAPWNAVLTVSTQVSQAIGGEPFLIQPNVRVTDRNGVFQPAFQGMVHTKLSYDNGKERLRRKKGVGDEQHDNGATNYSTMDGVYSVPIIEGEAHFSNLYVNKAAKNYRLRFLLTDGTGHSIATSYSEPFSVEVGEPYQIGVINNPPTVVGSIPFQCMVAVQDKGFNIVNSVNGGTVQIGLEENNLVVLKSINDTFSVSVVAGEAYFDGIYISKADVECTLVFTTDLPLDGGQSCESFSFTVQVGIAFTLEVANDVPSSIVAGMPFAVQPKVHLVDAGRNILRNENSLTVRAYIGKNPTGGSLTPASHTVAFLQGGVAQFKHLFIDLAVAGYFLCFDLMESDGITKYNGTKIFTCGSKFDVTVGLPHSLQVVSHPLRTWAGNQPFDTQPILRLVDAGGNIVVSDSSTVVEAFLVPSLGRTTSIVVDTRNDDAPKVVEIKFARPHMVNKEFVPGDVIYLKVIFSQEIIVSLSSECHVDTAIEVLPALELNIFNAGANVSSSFAYLVSDNVDNRTRYLIFEYNVVVGDAQNMLDILSGSSLNSNDFVILDLWRRPASLELPMPGTTGSLSLLTPVSVDDSVPYIVDIAIPLESGEYGAGHEIPFNVTFSRKVAVTGTPRLPIMVRSTVAIFDTLANSSILDGSHFFILYNGLRTKPILWNATSETVKRSLEEIPTIKGSVCVSRSFSSSALFGGHRWAVRFENAYDSLVNRKLEIDASGMSFSVRLGGHIAIQIVTASIPLPNWTSEDGLGANDMCTTRFAQHKTDVSSEIIQFIYSVLPGDTSDRIDIQRSPASEILLYSNGTSISLATSSNRLSPVQACVSFGTLSISRNVKVEVDTTPPNVVDIRFQSHQSDRVYSAGDTIFIEALFSKPVFVVGGVFMTLNTSPNVAIAKYESGSTTDTIVLRYSVEEGHMSSNLDYDSILALFATKIYSASVWRVATKPICEANLLLPNPPHSLSSRSKFIIDGSKPGIHQVTLEERLQGHRYGLGDYIGILVHFSSEVITVGVSPILKLVVGGKERVSQCELEESPTSTLKFYYRVVLGDFASQDTFRYKFDAALTLCSDSGCSTGERSGHGIFKYGSNVGQQADLTMSLAGGTPMKGVPFVGNDAFAIETSNVSRTTILSVTVSNGPGRLTRGDVLTIVVRFTDAVICTGMPPRLNVNLGQGIYGIAYASGSGGDSLIFEHIISDEDNTEQLLWVLNPKSTSPISCDAISSLPCYMKNVNGLIVDIGFVDEHGGKIVSQFDGSVTIDQEIPHITSVFTNKPFNDECQQDVNANEPRTCVYGVGEEFTIFVSFNLPVVVLDGPEPNLSLLLDTGISDKGIYGTFLSHNATLSDDFNLAFIYRVGPKQSSIGKPLCYVCISDNCHLGIVFADRSVPKIFRLSRYPGISADLSLPGHPGHDVSITASSRIIVETETIPLIVNVTSLSNDGTYSPGDEVSILIHFDKAVAVNGFPSLKLNVGQGVQGSAKYKGGSGTKVLSFQYLVEIGHRTRLLDYIDRYSLEVGLGEWIKQKTTHPSTDASILLPVPGLLCSLSASSIIEIDSGIPYIISVSSPNSGLHRAGDLITINVRFSSDVVVSGHPFLRLETGIIDRCAAYFGLVGADVLVFKYEVQLGDYSAQLDYWTSPGIIRKATSAFNLDGNGSIKRLSVQPMVTADLHLNPASGYLDGARHRRLDEGVAEYADLAIAQRGSGYKVRFRSLSQIISWSLESESIVDVDESSVRNS